MTTTVTYPDRPRAPDPAAEQIIARCRAIARCTEVPGQITRRFLTPPMHEVHALLRGWMEAAGLQVTVDAAGNLRGLFPAPKPEAGPEAGREAKRKAGPEAKPEPPRLILGSHLDTVPNAGAFDGILGVVLALAAVEQLRGVPLPCAVEIIGFSEEEGVRFRRPFLGSLAAAGRLDPAALRRQDETGATVAEAIRAFGLDPEQIPAARLSPAACAYVEVHIEQGPVLDDAAARTAAATAPAPVPVPVLGIVDTIVGQTRLHLTFTGRANHAGTTPMHRRSDALAAAAEWITAVESSARARPGLTATVGSLAVEPGAANIIPGRAQATLDLRHPDDAVRLASVHALLQSAAAAAARRGVRTAHELLLDQPAVRMDARLAGRLRDAAARAGAATLTLPSGAGHDAMILAPVLPAAMLFLASPGGLGHHPDESVRVTDVAAALHTLVEFLLRFGEDEAATTNHA